eukprot:TRINITY_DN6391_c0_g2_i3.p1 TRINITY_DN6391_c0_g2~~TRINITY_DN6391_c0_g2_i3.p1  ORF type:complete len:231 (+),score=20.13 TRINITY_DN6391_c0_g2_i3:58-750(+)
MEQLISATALLNDLLFRSTNHEALSLLRSFNQLYCNKKETFMSSELVPAFIKLPLIHTLTSRYLFLTSEVGLLTETIHALGLLARVDSSRHEIVTLGVIPGIVDAIKRYPSEVCLIEYSLFSLGNLSLDTEGKTEITQMGCISMLIEFLSSYSNAEGVIERTCFLLGNLAFHDSCKSDILSLGGVEKVSSLCPKFMHNAQLLAEVCFLFSNITVSSEVSLKHYRTVRESH